MGNNGNNSQRITCPSCSGEILVNPVSVIQENTPEVLLLIKGQLNKFACPSCEVEFLYDTPLVYRDDEHHFLIYYHSSATNDSVAEANGYMEEIYKELFADLPKSEKPVCRLALRRKDMIEKIKLHQQGYDDRLIEFIKYQLFHHSEKLDPSSMDLLFDFGATDQDNIIFLAFDQSTGNVLYSFDFPIKEYDELRKNFLGSPELEREFGKLFREYYVNVSSLLE